MSAIGVRAVLFAIGACALGCGAEPAARRSSPPSVTAVAAPVPASESDRCRATWGARIVDLEGRCSRAELEMKEHSTLLLFAKERAADCGAAERSGPVRADEVYWRDRPRVHVGQAEPAITFSPDYARAQARARHAQIDACYQKALEKEPELGGLLVVRYTVSRDGSIGSVRAASEARHADLEKCVAREFYGMSFPQPEGGIVPITQSLLLTAASPAARDPAGASPHPGERTCAADRPCGPDHYCTPGSFHCDPGSLASDACVTEPDTCQPRGGSGAACAHHFECKGLCLKNVCESFCESG